MKEIIAEQLSTENTDSITEATSFKDDLGLTYLSLLWLLRMSIPSSPVEDLQNLATCGDVMKYLKDKGVEE